MARFLSTWFGGEKRSARAAQGEFKPVVEALEERAVPTVSVVNGIIHVDGTSGNDVGYVSTYKYQSTVYYKVVDNGHVYNFNSNSPSGPIKGIAYSGGAGNDIFNNYTDLAMIANGGAGNDFISS